MAQQIACTLGGRFFNVVMMVLTASPTPCSCTTPSSSFFGSITFSSTAQHDTPQVKSIVKVEMRASFLNCVSPKEGPKMETRSREPTV